MEELREEENFIHNKYGYCYYALSPYPEVYNLYVEPKYRRQGHSKYLLNYVIEQIRKSGFEGKIKIEAQPRENSISLEKLEQYYLSLGFELYY